MKGIFILAGFALFFSGWRLYPFLIYGISIYTLWSLLGKFSFLNISTWLKVLISFIGGSILSLMLAFFNKIASFTIGFLTGFILFPSLNLIQPETFFFWIIRIILSIILGILLLRNLKYFVMGLTGFWGSYLLLSPFGYEKHSYILFILSAISFIFQFTWKRIRDRKKKIAE